MTAKPTAAQLREENRQLRERLDDLEETLRAIRSGEVDALVIEGPQGMQVFTLKGAEEQYRTMVEEMAEGALTFSPDGVILYCNQRFTELLKARQEQIIGALLPLFVAPEERPAFEALMSESRTAGRHRKFILHAADGTRVPVLFSTHPLKLDELEVIAAVAADLSQIEAAVEAQRESEEKFRYIFEHSPLGKSITSPSGGLLVNQAFCDMLGYSMEELSNRRWQDITHPEDIALSQKEVDALLAGERESARFTKRYLHKSGAVVWAEVSTALRRDAAGRPQYLMTSVMDITGRRQADEDIRRLNAELEQRVEERTAQLQAANRELEGFAYSVSHDLRTPLRAIDGFSQTVLKRYEGKLDDEGRRLLNVVRDNTKRMGQLIDDILAFSRAGRLEMKTLEVDMEALAREAWGELEPSLAGREVRLDIGPLPKVRGDPAMLRQVWVNLLGNAIKFTRRRQAARIDVGCNAEGAELIFYVKDNGAGFDMQYVDRLFSVFQRLHGIEEFEGTGIGLAIVKRIVARHSGRVWAEGKVDEGATFYFSLPPGK